MTKPLLTGGEIRQAVLHVLALQSSFRTTIPSSKDKLSSSSLNMAYARKSRLRAPSAPVLPELSSFFAGLEEPPPAQDTFGFGVMFAAMEHELNEQTMLSTLGNLVSGGLVRIVPQGYALTQAGISAAIEVHEEFLPARNVTTTWLNVMLTPAVVDTICYHLGKKCTKSVALDEIGDLVGTYFTKMMARDGLRKYLSEGKAPTVSQLKLWAYRSALTQFRDEGRDALTRTVKGARTERDLVDNPIEVLGEASEVQAIYLANHTDGMEITVAGGSGDCLVDVVDHGATSLSDDTVTLTAGLSLLEAVLRKRRPHNQDRFVRVLHGVMTGTTVREMADEEGVSRNRVASVVADMKDAVMEAVETGEAVRDILAYVRDEPYSTLEDINEDVGGATGVVPLLVSAGWLSHSNGSLLITESGSRLLHGEDSKWSSMALCEQLY